MARQGRVILGGDASFSLIHRRLAPDEQAFLKRFGNLSTIATLRAMARANSGDAALVEVKAVEPSWPALGTASLAPPLALAEALAEKGGVFGAAAEQALLARLDLKIGDTFHLGEATFVLNAVLESEPDRLAVGVGFGPRLLISQAALDATQLVQPGSLVRWTTRVVMGGAGGPPDEAAVKGLLAAAGRAFPEAGWETRSRLAVSPDFSRNIDRFAEFLTLAGLLSLVVGGVGVANAAQGFVEQKRATLAILKAIGATGTSVVGLALVEFLAVALAGALLGAALGAAIPFAIDVFFRDLIPIPLEPRVNWAIVALGLAYGLLTALAFALPPLSRAHDLPVTTLIRDLAEERQGWPRARYLVGSAVAAVALVTLAVVTSPQPTIALAVAGATLAAFGLLRLVALGLAFAARRAPATRLVELRMALSAIHRPGALTPSIVLSLGLGLAALVALSLIDFNMRHELSETLPGVTPSFFFLDLRSAEAPRFVDFLKAAAPGAKISETPMMRGRFVKLAGTPVAAVKATEKVAWALEGDRGVTFAASPPEGSEVTAGQWWAKDYSGPPLVSMEQEVGEGLGVKVGDTVVVNVLGRDITATVANFRKVNWRSYAINFVLVYSPNTFRGAPFSELVSTALPPGDGPDEGDCASARSRAGLSLRHHCSRPRRDRDGLGAGREARAGDPRRDRRRADHVRAGARRRARRQPPRAARRRDDPQDPRCDADPPQRDVFDRIRYSRRGDRAVRGRRRRADRLSRRHPDHARRIRLRLGGGARRRGRRARLHRDPRHDRRLAHPRPEAGGVLARIVIDDEQRPVLGTGLVAEGGLG